MGFSLGALPSVISGRVDSTERATPQTSASGLGFVADKFQVTRDGDLFSGQFNLHDLPEGMGSLFERDKYVSDLKHKSHDTPFGGDIHDDFTFLFNGDAAALDSLLLDLSGLGKREIASQIRDFLGKKAQAKAPMPTSWNPALGI